MSMYIDFEPHSWYKGFAIQADNIGQNCNGTLLRIWRAYTDNGNTYRIDEVSAATLAQLKKVITDYRSK